MDDELTPRTMPVSSFYFHKARLFEPIAPKSDRDNPGKGKHDGLHEVRVINNDYNTYQEVMEIAMLALGVDEQEAFAIAWEVDHRGSCVVAEAPHVEAEAFANIIRTIGIEVQVNPVIRITH